MQPNMLQATTTQLTYSLTTKPLPVEVSLSATSPSLATLIFVVSCPIPPGAVTISQITIAIPVDETGEPPDPTNLAMIAPPLSSASITSSGTDVWVPSAGAAPGLFIFTPKGGPVEVSEQSLTIEITGIQVSTLVGTAVITIQEFVTGSTTNTQTVAVAKFPYGFYAGNFTSNKPMVKNGEKPVLSWTGSSNATYLMLYESNAPIDVSNVRTWSPPNPLIQMTTFILQVSAQEAGQTATMDFSITIEVSNPSLTAQDFTVLTTSTLKGPVNVGVQGTPANLMVNGNVQSQGTMTAVQTFTAQSNAGVLGTLSVGGAATLSSTLKVTAAVSLGNTLNVTGATTLSGGLTSNSAPVSLFGTMVGVGLGTHTANTDGFVIGTVFPPATTDILYDLTITGSCNGMMVQATGGGTLKAVVPPNYYGVTTGGMFILPVRKGSTYTLGYITPYLTNPPKPFFTFYWIPLGTAPLGSTLQESTFEETPPAQLPASSILDPITRLPIRKPEDK